MHTRIDTNPLQRTIGRKLGRIVILACVVFFAGCANWPGSIRPGTSRAEVLERLGPPPVERAVNVSETRPGTVAGERVMIYPTGPMGQYTFALRLGADGRVTAVEQILSLQNFARAKRGEWRREDLMNNFGPPSEVRQLRRDLIWWSYRYLEGGVWNSLFTFILDGSGVVRDSINAPDPMFEIEDNWMLWHMQGPTLQVGSAGPGMRHGTRPPSGTFNPSTN